jgi:hypothetical protein
MADEGLKADKEQNHREIVYKISVIATSVGSKNTIC